MINFRFHIASLIAVFLALALGIVIGSTVIDRAIVDRLNNRITDIEGRADRTDQENDELQTENDRYQAYIEQIQGLAVDDQLDGVPVVPVALRGIDEGSVQATVELAQAAGGEVPGILWLEGKLALDDEAAIEELGAIVGTTGLSRRETRELAWEALALRLGDEPALVSPRADAELLPALADAGFVQFQPIGDTPADFSLSAYPGAGARVLLVDGTGADLTLASTVDPLARALHSADVPLVVGEVYQDEDGGPDRGAGVETIRSDDELKDAVSSVDDLDLVEGRVAAVLALAGLGDGAVGHYGYGTGATAAVPAPAPTGS